MRSVEGARTPFASTVEAERPATGGRRAAPAAARAGPRPLVWRASAAAAAARHPPRSRSGAAAASGSSLQARLAALRRFRDGELVRSAAGRRYVALLDAHGAELLALVSRSAALWTDASATLRALADAALASSAPQRPELDARLVVRIRGIVERVADDASPPLRSSLGLVARDLAGLQREDARAGRPPPAPAPVRLAPAATLVADAAGAVLALGGTVALWVAVLVAVG